MSLRILKSRPKPNLDIASRRKPFNTGECNGNKINKSQPDKLSKCEEEVKTPFGVSPSRIVSDTKSPIVCSGTDAGEQVNSSIINKQAILSERNGNNLKTTQTEKIKNKNEDKVEISAKKEIVLSETVSDTTQKPDTETKLSTDVGKTNSKKKIELKKEGKPVSNSESPSVAVDGPLKKKFCPNLLKSHKTAENTLKPLVGSLISERKPEMLQLGEDKISNIDVEDNDYEIESPSSSLKSSIEEVTEKLSVKSIPQPCNGNKKLIHQNFKVKVNPKVISDVPGKKTLRVKITIDDGKQPKKDLNSEKEKKKLETLNKLLGKETGNIPDDGVHLTYELDTSDESNISDCKDTVTMRDSAIGKVSPLMSSSCRSSRMNNVKPNLATASTRFSPFNQSSYGQMNQDAKQKFKLLYGDRSPERSKMTMKDLIFYNPKNNPISEQSNKNKDLLPETEIISNSDANQSQFSANSEDSDILNGDDDIEEKQVNSDENRAIDKNGVPVPQLKITADGKIIIAPESLVVKTKHDTAKKEWRPLIVENDFTHHKIMKKKSLGEKKNWTFQETLKFYKLLHTTGSDFSTMAQNFPDRTRNCLKRKFKREEKLNGHLIDRVLPGRILTDEEFEAVEQELAVNKMWEEIEKCSRRKSDLLPEIPDISQGITEDMFLSVKEKKNIKKKGLSKTSSKPENGTAPYVNILLDGVSNLAKTKSNKHKPRTKRKVLKLKEYFSIKEDTLPTVQPSINSILKNRVLQISNNDSENRSASDDEVMMVEEDMSVNKPIVVNTSIESSGIKYTKSITFNPSNLDNPVDINETISHNVQEYPSSTDIIDEIVNILSSDGQSPTVHNLENGNNDYTGARNNTDNSEGESVIVLNETIEK